MPKKKSVIDDAKKALAGARLLRDRALKSISEIHIFAKNTLNDTSLKHILEVRARQLCNFEKQFRAQQDIIVHALVELDRIDEFESIDSLVTDEMESMFYEIIAVSTPAPILTPVSTDSTPLPPPSGLHQNILPKIELPHFDGNIINWRSFRDIFNSLVNENMSISKIEKFHYLLSCLSGPSLTVVKSLPLTASNYDSAWQALMTRYDNQRALATAHLDKIFTFKPIQQESLPSLNAFLNVFHENVAALKRLEVEDLSGFLLFYMGAKVLDSDTRLLFEATVLPSELPCIEHLVDFIRQRCRILENVRGRDSEKGERHHPKLKINSTSKSILTTSTGPKKEHKKCPFCPEFHPVYRCKIFKEYPVQKRREIAQGKNLCYSCLSLNHTARVCQSKLSCSICKKRHHSLLHLNTDAPSPPQKRESEHTAPQEYQQEFAGLSCSSNKVVLGTAIIRMRNCHGAYQNVRVLLDSGSQVSAITMRCVSNLGLQRRKCHLNIVGLAKKPVDDVKGMTSCNFMPLQHNKPSFCCTDVVILSQITTPMPTSQLPSSIRDRYEHLVLADPAFDSPAPIDMLIGGDLFPHVIRPRANILHHQGLPSALDTFFGWVICGSLDERDSSSIHSLSVASSLPLNDVMQAFWSIEEVTQPPQPTTEDEQCEKWFNQNTSRDMDGRFCVGLPFKDTVPFEQNNIYDKKKGKLSMTSVERFSTNHGLGESRSLALKRLFNLENRLSKDPPLYAEYRSFMQEYLALGHMKIATQPGRYFIPHHAVVKRDGERIEKLRVVFDASASTSSGLSLNDVLIPGPKLQTDIFDILLKCRVRRFVFTADITKMYRQILVSPNDCAYQHILWRDNPSDQMIEFELLTVTYGVTSAPYLAIRCLHELDIQTGPQFPTAKNVLTQSTYVDDIVIGADTEKELLQIQLDIIGLLKSCGCSLKKWTSNCPVILEQVNAEHHSDQMSLDPKDEASVKVLGLHWEPISDNFAYHISLQPEQYTKRKVLSTIARLFDPIGVLGPTLLWAKHFMQELWKLGLHWDTPLPNQLQEVWEQFVRELPSLTKIALPRHIDIRENLKIQLMGFSDASQRGYAAIVYLRVVRPLDQISVYFITCKTKVAPLTSSKGEKELSIPRLELCAALLLAQTLNRVKTVLSSELSISSTHAWTDSTVVLSWLTTHQRSFKIFVTNRIAKIHALLPECEWSYVNTTENPADPASRGLLPHATVLCKVHQEGPPFLRLPIHQWPSRTFSTISPDQLPEYQHKLATASVATVSIITLRDDIIQRFSSFTRMLRVLAYVKRLAFKAQKKEILFGPLKQRELQTILIRVAYLTQQSHFPDLYRQLTASDSSVRPATLAQLTPFIDSSNLIRVGGRLRYASLDPDAKHPILLPKSSKLTELVIQHFHQGFLHAGPKLVLGMIRRKFWILSGRDAVRQYIFGCVTCVRHKAIRPNPIMGQLPSFRVQQHRPFNQVGLDYGGPFVIKESRRRNAKTSKSYLALFVCMTVKAVHLELVTDMSTAAFLAALDRFVARRGIPSDLFSDCGTNYVGAARQLKELFREANMQDAVTTRVPCRWHFNPPAAPHFGGLWEAAIRSTKHHMKHVIGSQIFTYEELSTLISRIEGILNSRPLTSLSSDPHDLCALTPGHFLIGQPVMSLPEYNYIETPINRLNRWELLQQLQQTFWKRWTREYLTTLQGRTKWYQSCENLVVGDLVIVEAPNRPPTDWQLGRVINVHPGLDGVVRVATVQTQEGVLKRPIVKLVKLPVSSPDIADATS